MNDVADKTDDEEGCEENIMIESEVAPGRANQEILKTKERLARKSVAKNKSECSTVFENDDEANAEGEPKYSGYYFPRLWYLRRNQETGRGRGSKKHWIPKRP